MLFAGCRFGHEESVDFLDLDAAKDLKFRVISQQETDLSDGLPDNCYLPDGTPVNAYSDTGMPADDDNEGGPRKTNSTTGTNIVQQLLKFGNQHRVTEIVGTYDSYDADWNSVTLSGKVMLPASRKPRAVTAVPLNPEQKWSITCVGDIALSGRAFSLPF